MMKIVKIRKTIVKKGKPHQQTTHNQHIKNFREIRFFSYIWVSKASKVTEFRSFFLLIFLFTQLPFLSFAQPGEYLSEYSDYPALEKKIKSLENQPEQSMVYVEMFIRKAKKEGNADNIHKGYLFATFNSREEIQLKYGDSLIVSSIKLNDRNKTGEALLSQALVYQGNENYEKSLEYTLDALKIFEETKNLYLINTAKYSIAEIKTFLGAYSESNTLFIETTEFFRNNQKRIGNTDYRLYYLYSLLGLIGTENRLKHFSESQNLIDEGKAYVSKNREFLGYFPYFVSSEGTNFYFQNNYPKAIEKLNEALKLYDDKWKHLTEKFYIGMSYYHLNQYDKAIPYLQLIEKDYDETGKLFPEFRPGFEAMIDIYKNKADKDLQLHYIDKLLIITKKENESREKIRTRLEKKMGETELLAAKKELENYKKWQKFAPIWIGTILIVAGLLFYRNRSKKLRKKISPHSEDQGFSTTETPETIALSLHNDAPFTAEPTEITPTTLPLTEPESSEPTDFSKYAPIRKETVLLIQKKLATFEEEKRFTYKNIKLSSLARDFGTNEKYISAIIKADKEKNFNEYLSDLRIDYFLQLLKIPENKLKSITELSEKTGFTNNEMFHKEFKKKFGVSVKQYFGKD